MPSFLTATVAAILSSAIALAGPSDILSDPQAKAHVSEAEIMFSEGRFADAATQLEKAYLIEPRPELLYPWAQAEREQGHCDAAVELYQQFLEERPEGAMADNARANIERCGGEGGVVAGGAVADDEELVEVIDDDELAEDDLDELVENAEPEPEPKPQPKPTVKDDQPKAKKWYRDPLGGVLTGLGVVGVGGGAALIAVAVSRADGASTADSVTDYRDEQDSATTLRNAGAGVLTVGGALLLGGIVRYVIVNKKNKAAATASLWTTPEGGGVVISGRF